MDRKHSDHKSSQRLSDSRTRLVHNQDDHPDVQQAHQHAQHPQSINSNSQSHFWRRRFRRSEHVHDSNESDPQPSTSARSQSLYHPSHHQPPAHHPSHGLPSHPLILNRSIQIPSTFVSHAHPTSSSSSSTSTSGSGSTSSSTSSSSSSSCSKSKPKSNATSGSSSSTSPDHSNSNSLSKLISHSKHAGPAGQVTVQPAPEALSLVLGKQSRSASLDATSGSKDNPAHKLSVPAIDDQSKSVWSNMSTVQLASRWRTVHRRSSRLTDLLPPEQRQTSGRYIPTQLIVTAPTEYSTTESDNVVNNSRDSGGSKSTSGDIGKSRNDSNDSKSVDPSAYTPNRRRSSSLAPPDAEEFVMSRKRSKSPRQNSQLFLMGDDTLLMQFDGSKRRLSSFFSNSSMDETVVNMDDGGLTEEEMMETLKTHRQIIAHTKTQNWPMHRKLKILRRAKMYLKKHEGDMKQSSQAKDILATYRTYIEKFLHRMKREIDNLIVIFTPWEMRIKKIESQFGSVVASYFMFLRWIFWINTFIGIVYTVFVMVPEILLDKNHFNDTRGLRKIKEEVDKPFLTTISEINEFDGFLKFSPIFYGYYDTEKDSATTQKDDFYYPLPLIYFVITLLLFAFSFMVILRKMTKNARLQRIGAKDNELIFCLKLFTGWDYMIGNSETAYNKVASIVMGFKEVILEENEKKKEVRNWQLFACRFFINLLVLAILCGSSWAIVWVVQRSMTIAQDNFIARNEVNFVFAAVQGICPIAFNFLAKFEKNHPRVALRWQLGRILVLNILNFVCLLLSTFQKVESQTKQLQEIKDNLTMLHKFELEQNISHLNELTTEGLDIQTATFLSVIRDKRQEGEGRMFPPEKVWNSHDKLIETKPVIDQNLLDSYYEEPIEGRQIQPKKVKQNTIFDSGGGRKSSTLLDIYKLTTGTNGSMTATPFHMKTSTVMPTHANVSTTGDVSTNVDNMTTTGTISTVKPMYKPNNSTRRGRPYRPYATHVSKGTTPMVKLSSSSSTTTTTPMSTTPDVDYDDPSLVNVSVSSLDLSGIREWNTSKDLNVDLAENSTAEIDIRDYLNSKRKCTDEPEPATDPFVLFKLAQKREQFGYENYTNTLKGLCWETSFGQELVKLTVTEMYMTVISTIFMDYLLAVVIRYCNGCPCFCWDLEMGWPKYPDFAIAENILSLVNSQGVIWLGMYFAPGLPAINTLKLCVMMYIKSWAVLTSNIPHETVFKASGSNNFYYGLLLLMLFLSCLPVAYCVVWFEPSWHCGPFSNQIKSYHILTKKLEANLPDLVNRIINYACSAAFVIPLIMFLMLIIYYMSASLASFKDANSDLKAQLRKDKEEPFSPLTDIKHVRIDEPDKQQSTDR